MAIIEIAFLLLYELIILKSIITSYMEDNAYEKDH